MNYEILQRYIEGNITEQEKEDIVKWLDADDKNMQEFLSLRNLYDVILWNGLNNDSISEKPKNKRVKLFREILKIAAVFLIALGCYHLFQIYNTNNAKTVTYQTVYVPEGQRAEIILADSTKVWLNAKSQLIFPTQFSKDSRTVELNGEAYFEVAHDKSKQFIVKTQDYSVKVLGTKFDVRAYPEINLFETSLIEGSVEVISNSSDERAILTPNYKVYAEGDKLIRSEFTSLNPFLWKEGIISFEDECVKDIIDKLELYYDVKIHAENKNKFNDRYTGKFWINDGIDHILRVLQFRHKFTYTKDDMNNITIHY